MRGSLRLGARSACTVIFLALICLPMQRAARAQQGPTDSEVKAAYLFNFLKFVDWPEEAGREPQSAWVLCVLGDTPVGEDLKHLVAGKSIRGREMQEKQVTAIEELKGCHMLFIAAPEKKRLPAILAEVHGSTVLTVADMDHFVETGGMIQFVIQDSRPSLLSAGTSARLKISSKLLSLAVAVIDSGSSGKN